MHNGNAVDKKPMKADTSLMHPKKNIIALKGKNESGSDFVQVYNLDTKAKLGVFTAPEDVTLMSWVSLLLHARDLLKV